MRYAVDRPAYLVTKPSHTLRIGFTFAGRIVSRGAARQYFRRTQDWTGTPRQRRLCQRTGHPRTAWLTWWTTDASGDTCLRCGASR